MSKDGGGAPDWHTGGRELYFLSPGNRLMSVRVTVTAGTFNAATPLPLFPINSRLNPGMQVSISDDRLYATIGDRFLVTENEPDPRAATINVY